MTVRSQPYDSLNIRITPEIVGIGGLVQKPKFAPAVFRIGSGIGR